MTTMVEEMAGYSTNGSDGEVKTSPVSHAVGHAVTSETRRFSVSRSVSESEIGNQTQR